MPRGSASPTSTWHQRIVLPLECSSASNVSTRPTTSGPVTSAPGVLDRLDLEAEHGQPVGQLATVDVGRQVDVLAQPRHGDPHQISIPNGRVNRTSPSTMSRMSSTPWRNIRVRSMPMPNAKPE